MLELLEPVQPSEEDARQAQVTVNYLTRYLENRGLVQLQIVGGEQSSEAVPLPAAAVSVLREVLLQLAAGHAVTVVPSLVELTTQQAADLLQVSRPYLVKLLETDQIPHHKVGTHRRVCLADLQAFQQETEGRQREAVRDLTALSEELGLYD